MKQTRHGLYINVNKYEDAKYILDTRGDEGLRESFRCYHSFCKDPEKLERLVEHDLENFYEQGMRRAKNISSGLPANFCWWKFSLITAAVGFGLYVFGFLFIMLTPGIFFLGIPSRNKAIKRRIRNYYKR